MSDSSAKIYMDIGRYKIASQEDHYREVTDKSLRLAAYTALMFGLGGAVVRFTDPSLCLFLLFCLQVIALGFATLAAAMIAHPAGWRNFPEMDDLIGYRDDPGDMTCLRIGQCYSQIIKANRLVLDQKTKWLKVAVWSTVVQMVLLGLVVCTSLFSRW